MTKLNREQWLSGAIGLLIDELNITGLPTIKATVGQAGKAIISRSLPIEQSEDGIFHILISVHCNDSIKILARSVHELAHALTRDCKKHDARFAAIAGSFGLLSPFTKHESLITVDLRTILKDIVSIMGEIPHERVEYLPEQKGRNSAIVRCSNCGFRYNTSRKWIARLQQNMNIHAVVCNGCTMPNTLIIT